MKQIRTSVFETNSSSSHSLSIGNDCTVLSPNKLKPVFDNKINLQFDEYGWSGPRLTTQEDRFKYLCTMWWCVEGCRASCVFVHEFANTPGFKIIKKALKKHVGLILEIDAGYDSNIKACTYGTYNKFDINGYIDHQSSYDKYTKLSEFLKSHNLTAEQFIFCDNVSIIIDNDNH